MAEKKKVLLLGGLLMDRYLLADRYPGRGEDALVREERRQAGDCFLDGDWRQKAKKARPLRDWCLTEEGVEVSLPQCAAAPAAEGGPVFVLPLEEKSPLVKGG